MTQIDERDINVFDTLFSFGNALKEDALKEVVIKLNGNTILPEFYDLINNSRDLSNLYQQMTAVTLPGSGSLLNITFFPSIYKKVIELPNKRVSRYL